MHPGAHLATRPDHPAASDVVADAHLAAALIAACRERLAGFKCPRSVDFVASLPRQPNGKLLKRVLRDQYAATQR